MNLFIKRHQDLLALLLQYQVEFIIIGGYSVIFHGYARTTGDVDLWLKPDNENRSKLIDALNSLDISSESLHQLSTLDFSKHLSFYIWEEPEKVDFLTYVNGVTFEDGDKMKIIAGIDDLMLPFLHLNHLILTKMTTDRLKDKADIEELQKIYRHRK